MFGGNVAFADEDKKKVLSRNFIADAVSIASPSVVNIVSPIHGMMATGVSSGSGFILSKDGFIVTNAHVVSQSYHGTVVVTLWDHRHFDGKVHSIDRLSDIALIKIENATKEDLPVAKMGASGKLKAGEFVVALGSPMHLTNSVTFGIVSSPARHGSDLGIENNRTNFIQTDAAINIGNSGGPLVNLDGEVIGINAIKAQGVDGISFAIPIDTAKIIINQLLKNKKVIRPYVGLKLADFIVDQPGGAPARNWFQGGAAPMPNGLDGLLSEVSVPMVVEVTHGSPAQIAGLQRGDIILEMDGKSVKTVAQILESIGLDIGKTIAITIMRKAGKERSKKILYVTTAPE